MNLVKNKNLPCRPIQMDIYIYIYIYIYRERERENTHIFDPMKYKFSLRVFCLYGFNWALSHIIYVKNKQWKIIYGIYSVKGKQQQRKYFQTIVWKGLFNSSFLLRLQEETIDEPVQYSSKIEVYWPQNNFTFSALWIC